ncbi:MAG: right-handed parallel beta-helix repeat-containing protein [Phycisphaerales bacterium]|nr:MAG: right-handed parallel beta-helix repeat-containing protein [Phycisphaerales bacterium]
MRAAILLGLAIVVCAGECGQAVTRLVPDQYATIQAAIDDCNDGDVVQVAPGTYTGDGNRDIDFKGKVITVRSEEGPGTCVINCQGSEDDPHRGFYFHSGEEEDSVLQGLTITGAYMSVYRGGAIYCYQSSPTIRECTLVRNIARAGGGIACSASNSLIVGCIISDNLASSNPRSWLSSGAAGGGGGIYIVGHHPIVANCIISGNRSSEYGGGIDCAGDPAFVNCTIYGNRTGYYGYGGGILCRYPDTEKGGVMRNCIIWGNTARTCQQIANRGGGIAGEMPLELASCIVQNDADAICTLVPIEGNWTSKEPYFANPGHWEPYEPNDRPPGYVDYLWVDGDYHLKSQAGRYDPDSGTWVTDGVTSPCIDGGDPFSPIGQEPFPHGGIINIGAYGGTAEASKSYFGEPVCDTIVAGDINGDCKIDFMDFNVMALHWLEER